MEDIQFWVYILFGLIYFITRSFGKKKQKKQPQNSSRPQPRKRQGSKESEERPLTFEELLKEVTGQSSLPNRGEEEEPEFEEIEEEVEYKPLVTPEEEGRKRSFADAESKKIYEESIKRAQSSSEPIEFERDIHFLKNHGEENQEESEIVKDIKRTLQNPSEARKAIILSEILNRKY